MNLLLLNLPTLKAAVPTNQKLHLIGYWGDNYLTNLYPYDTPYWEPTLLHFCKNTAYSIYHITSVKAHFSGNALPGIHFGYHCQWPTNKVTMDWPGGASGFSMLSCRNIGADIKACQALGKKIVLSISPMDALTSDADGKRSAINIWNWFGGGKPASPYAIAQRPFGDAVIDGVELRVFNNDAKGYVGFLSKMRELMNADLSKVYYISAYASCQFPDFILNWPNTTDSARALDTIPSTIDYVSIFFVSNPNMCGWNLNNAGFDLQLAKWATRLHEAKIPMIVGITSSSTPAFANAAITDNVAVKDLPALISRVLNVNGIAGIGLYEASFDVVNLPCEGSTLIYSSIVRRVIDTGGIGSCIAKSSVEIGGPPVGGGGDLDRAFAMKDGVDNAVRTREGGTAGGTGMDGGGLGVGAIVGITAAGLVFSIGAAWLLIRMIRMRREEGG